MEKAAIARCCTVSGKEQNIPSAIPKLVVDLLSGGLYQKSDGRIGQGLKELPVGLNVNILTVA